jgi:hypothetical protein
MYNIETGQRVLKCKANNACMFAKTLYNVILQLLNESEIQMSNTTVKTVKVAVQKFPKIRKVDVVKSIIADAKATNKSIEDVLSLVMQTVGFKRQLARVYVLGHWDGVEAKKSYAVMRLEDCRSL